jgi:hypothetical protein
MDGLKRYDDFYTRLLFDRRVRAQVRSGGWSAAGPAAEAFEGVDLDKLEKLSGEIRDGLIQGYLGGLGIGPAFPDTIAALGGDINDLVERFLADHQALEAIDGTGRRAGVCVLESFYVWALSQLTQRPDAHCRAQHEFAAALIGALAQSPDPGFVIRWPLVRRLACGWCCVLDLERPLTSLGDEPEHPAAYIAVTGRYAHGPMALSLAAVMLEDVEAPPLWVAGQLERLDPATLEATRRALLNRPLS